MKFLVFQHIPNEHPGFITKAAQEKGIQLDTIEFWKPYKIPSISSYQALIVMGGPMEVYHGKDLYPSKEDELAVIKEALEKMPILGICLGSQLIAYALGGNVYPNIINGKIIKEIGYYDVDLTKEGQNDPLFKGFSEKTKVLQWHGGAFDLPKGAKLLATSPACTNQAFSYKNAYGLLFHMEFTPVMVEKQIEGDKEWIHKDFELDEDRLLEEAKQKAKLMAKQSEILLSNFLRIISSK
ncbi:type 1 glutamine amidotransferase [Candidatus Gottesmanbacteria bacterium]|nr:type 1 glutamine amidotransferase [Candidatus Gottesmanbacteria bacterium]